MPEENKIVPNVVIQRATWRCGGSPVDPAKKMNTHGASYITTLLNMQGFRCCLGFACQQLGDVSDDNIRHMLSPSALNLDVDDANVVIPYLTTLNGANTLLTNVAMKINDDSNLSRYARETALEAVFEMAGIKLTFEGDYSE